MFKITQKIKVCKLRDCTGNVAFDMATLNALSMKLRVGEHVIRLQDGF